MSWPAYSATDGSRGLWIVDVTDPRQPQVVAHHMGIVRYSTTAVPNRLTKMGDLVFVTQVSTAQSDSVIEIIDVSCPSRPQTVGAVRGTFTPYHMVARDSIAYVATADSGLLVYDLHDLSNPKEVFVFNKSSSYSIFGVTIAGSFLYADRIDTFFVMSISTPQSPTIMGKFGRNYGSFTSIDLCYSRGFVYWAEGYLGVVDVSNPSSPKEKETILGIDWGRGVAASNDLVFFADQSGGMWIWRNKLVTSIKPQPDRALPTEYELSQNYPNPFNGGTVIEFALPQREQIRLEVFDLLGRRVATLIDGVVDAGRHKVFFGPRDLSTGVYFYRMRSSHITQARRMLLLK